MCNICSIMWCWLLLCCSNWVKSGHQRNVPTLSWPIAVGDDIFHGSLGAGNITSHRLREYEVKKLRSPASCMQMDAILFTQPIGSNISGPSTGWPVTSIPIQSIKKNLHGFYPWHLHVGLPSHFGWLTECHYWRGRNSFFLELTVHAVTIYEGQRGFQTSLSQKNLLNFNSCVPKFCFIF